jgi:Pregnancy-associated plasma protein-A
MHRPHLVFLLHCLSYLPTNILGASLPEIPGRYCGTEDPSSTLRFAHSYLSWAEPFDNDLQNASTVESRIYSNVGKKTKRQALTPLYTIDTYIHIIADRASAFPTSPAYVTDSQIRAQLEYLARAYANASIGFRLVGYSRHTNDIWARNGDDLGMKTSLRRGGYSTLNIYYQSQLQAAPGTPGIPAGSILLGFCSLPAAGVGTRTPAAAYVLDGSNILSSTMPGGSTIGYNEGGSTAHEVGHWNGLLHTFQGNSCSSSNYGDYVADTPQQATSTDGCPARKDSCPSSGLPPGFDGSSGEYSLHE